MIRILLILLMLSSCGFRASHIRCMDGQFYWMKREYELERMDISDDFMCVKREDMKDAIKRREWHESRLKKSGAISEPRQ